MNIADFPVALRALFQPARYKVLWGGRGGAKSWGIARALLILAAKKKLRILCARETMKSIADSVHKLLSDQIIALSLQGYYTVERSRIIGRNGTEIVFAGLKHNINNIKSLEACDIVWVEEAQTTTKMSWAVLIPTIRKEGSEIWVSFNPDLTSDDTYRRFVLNPPPNAVVLKVGWQDNPWFPATLRAEMEHLRATDPDAYSHVWEGNCISIADGAIYANEIRAAESDSRLTTRVSYDATLPVHTFWDLGWGDATAIWLAQVIGNEYHLIDYICGEQKPLSHYITTLQARGYIYGTDYLPHDARAHELGSGRSVEELMRKAGRKVQIVKKLSPADGINAARTIFNRCWFDPKTKEGVEALRHYRYEKDEDLGIAKRIPLHDWSSNGADAFRYLAVAITTPARDRSDRRAASVDLGDDAWMA
jgi:phage terminase large subunit